MSSPVVSSRSSRILGALRSLAIGSLIGSLIASLGMQCPQPGGQDAGSWDAGTDGPIVLPAERWIWVDFPDTVCGNGQPTGLGVNLSERSTDVLIYLEGGGACWDAEGCVVRPAAVHIADGYTAATFAEDDTRGAVLFNRTAIRNPLRDASFVLIPYCTGDLYAGDRVTTYTVTGDGGRAQAVHHRGAANIAAYLRRLAPTFPGPRRIFVAGSSAGGYGAQLQFHQFVAAFPDASVHCLADSAQLVPPRGDRLAAMRSAWDLQPPPGCPRCAEDWPAWTEYLMTNSPRSRFALLAYDADLVLVSYFGYGLGPQLKQATYALLDRYDAHDNAKYFVVAGGLHTMLGRLTTLTGPGGARLDDWVAAWMRGDPGWTSVK